MLRFSVAEIAFLTVRHFLISWTFDQRTVMQSKCNLHHWKCNICHGFDSIYEPWLKHKHRQKSPQNETFCLLCQWKTFFCIFPFRVNLCGFFSSILIFLSVFYLWFHKWTALRPEMVEIGICGCARNGAWCDYVGCTFVWCNVRRTWNLHVCSGGEMHVYFEELQRVFWLYFLESWKLSSMEVTLKKD